MIANICAFKLWCFAIIMTNIKKIHSAGNHQINPVRFFIQTSPENYVRTVNNFQTFNKNPITITPADQRILSTRSVNSIKKYKLKLKIQEKLEKKAEDIKCSFCLIAKSNILYMKNLVETLKNGEPFVFNESAVRRFKQEAEIILYLLLLGNLETGKWLWSFLLKINAIRQYEDNKTFIHENPFEDDQLQTGVSDFIGHCIAEKYLPPNAIECDLVSKKRIIYNNMFSDLCNSGCFLGVILDRDYDTMIEFLYLKPFWDDERQLLFRPITQVDVDWSKAKHRHDVEVVITREFVQNRLWIYHPYGRLDHQHLLINIIDARIYCHLSVILYVYEKQLLSILDKQTLTDIKQLVYNVIYAALTLTTFKDEFLVLLISEFKFAKISDIGDIKDMLARVRTKANGILNDLNGSNTSKIDPLGFEVDEHQLSTNDFIIGIIKDFEDYLTEFNDFLPFQYKSFLHFMDVVKMSAAKYI